MARLTSYCLLLLCGALFACNQQRDIRDYYFPVRELIDGRVYAYENTGTLPGPDTEYWYYLGVDLDTALHLSATRYGPTLAPEQQSRREIRNEGVYLREMTLLTTDSSGVATPIPTSLNYVFTFPFYHDAAYGAAYGYRLSLRTPDNPDALTYVTLDRRFRGDTTVTVLDKSYAAIVFDLAGEVSLRDPEEGDISPQFTGYEIYAKGLGLVEYQRDLGDGQTLGGRLRERIPMGAFAEEVLPMQ